MLNTRFGISFTFTKASRSALIAVALLAQGCSPTVTDQRLPFKPDPVAEAKAILDGYVAGQPVDSESAVFDSLVHRVTEIDEAKAAELRKFFDDIRSTGVVNRAKAKQLVDRF